MLNALDQITAAGVFTGVFKVAERFVFAPSSGASLDQDFKKDAGYRIPFKFYDLLCCGGDTLESADCNRGAAAICHFQVPYARHNTGMLQGREGRKLPISVKKPMHENG